MSKIKKIFILDTSVILFDHESILQFDEHDIGIPIQVLEELDTFKKGNNTIHYEARSFIRLLNDVGQDELLNKWVKIPGKLKGRFKVILSTENHIQSATAFDEHKNDNKIINAAIETQLDNPEKKVVLVSKDICLRVKAKSLNIHSENYEAGKIENVDKLYKGHSEVSKVDSAVIDNLFKDQEVPSSVIKTDELPNNHYLIIKNGKKSALGHYDLMNQKIHRIEKKSIYKITPKNAEQAFALHALMNPNVKLMTLRGVAGTGKTLLALAAALEQRRNFRQIFVTRPVVPLSNKDLGFLPGDIHSKMDPYMQPIWDNLKFIKSLFTEKDKENKRIDEMLENDKITVAPLAYIRGRTLANVFFIIDEAQNLTPHEVKTIVTRAGENTKIVFTGDINQIDTPYLDAESNGLSYVIDRVKNHPLFAHVNLEKGERSELANLANELL